MLSNIVKTPIMVPGRLQFTAHDVRKQSFYFEFVKTKFLLSYVMKFFLSISFVQKHKFSTERISTHNKCA